MPMRYFISAGEPSGDLHGANLVAEVRRLDPEAEFVGFGGTRLQAAGCRLLAPIADTPIMGLTRAFAAVPRMIRLLGQAEREIQSVDTVVVIDNPGFNFHVARVAKRQAVPVHYYVPPQIWGWGTWRVAKMRKFTDQILCALPFEEAWYHSRGVTGTKYVGHPFFDDLDARVVDDEFIGEQRDQDERRIVALLPGSRTMEVEYNIAGIVDAACRLHHSAPDVRFLVAAFREEHRGRIVRALGAARLPVEVHVGRTPEILRLADAAISVSGSVSLELLYHAVPTAIVYRVNPLYYHVLRPLLLRSPYITLVNLMAGRQLFPEFLSCRDCSSEVADVVGGWLTDASSHAALVARLRKLKDLYCFPGAGQLAAQAIVPQTVAQSTIRRAG